MPHKPLKETIENIAIEMEKLSIGQLAQLRRMDPAAPGTAAYWHLARQCDLLNQDAPTWMQIIKTLAILMPKGELFKSDRLHDGHRRFGRVLCDGGNPEWQGARPVLSEARFMRFLKQPLAQRAQALESIARRLAKTRDRASGVNCQEIAALFHFPNDKEILRRMAEDYYKRLDEAEPKTKETENA